MFTGDEKNTGGFGDFDAVAETHLDWVDLAVNGHLFGSGTAFKSRSLIGSPNLRELAAASSVSLFFRLTREVTSGFMATLSRSDSDESASAFLFRRGQGFVWNDFPEDPQVQLHIIHRGVLRPGFYSFGASASVGPNTLFGDAAFDMDFLLGEAAATAEPASLVLVSVGLIGAAARVGAAPRLVPRSPEMKGDGPCAAPSSPSP